LKEKPLLVFDGDCGFCRYWVDRWKLSTRGRINFAAYQDVAVQYPAIPMADFQSAIQLILPDGTIQKGAKAVFTALAGSSRTARILLRIYQSVPGASKVAEEIYSLVAGHRPIFSALIRLVSSPDTDSAGALLSRWAYLRVLAAAYLIAFASLHHQVLGLIGSEGITPAVSWMKAVRAQGGPGAFWFAPTVFWLGASDGALKAACWAGEAAACAALVGFAPVLSFLVCWVLYLSFLPVSGDFLGFQWDVLLLEAGFLGIFLAPLQLRPNLDREAPPPGSFLWLGRWLLFRLVFFSGLVKLWSGDTSWRDLTALKYHYMTQPLPTPLGWYAYHLPLAFQKFSTAAVLALELIVPIFLWGPAVVRRVACWTLIVFQGLIMATGNYCFFNFLTIGLLLLALDRGAWPAAWLRRVRARRAWSTEFPAGRWPGWVTAPVFALVFLLTLVQISARTSLVSAWPGPVRHLAMRLAPFYLANSYGLFAVMTTTRPEIVIEGSEDGKRWFAYEFKYKPGDLSRRPAFVAPYQPRLDWQLWFAALSSYRDNPWFVDLCYRLLEGSPAVLALLKTNPFPLSPPRYLRATLYNYDFSTFREKSQTHRWWKRELQGPYCPVLSIRDRELS